MAFKGPMLPKTLKGSNIDEGVTDNDLHLLFSTSSHVEWINFQTSTCAFTTRKKVGYNGKNHCNKVLLQQQKGFCKPL